MATKDKKRIAFIDDISKETIGLTNVENKSSATICSEINKENVTNALGYTPPASDTTYNIVNSSTDGLMSKEDKTKLDGIEGGATRVIVDSEYSLDSTNPVQNKVIQTSFNEINEKLQTVEAHKESTNNPHNVTATQVGSYTKSETDTNINTALNTAKSYTDTKTADLVNKANTSDLTTHISDTTKHLPSGGAAGCILAKSSGGGALWRPPMSNPNLLDNWYFADPINQRGQAEYTAAGYMIDRWAMSLKRTSTGKISITASGIKITTNPGTDTSVFFGQYIENATLFLGKALTASILLANEGCFSVTTVVPASLPASNTKIASASFGSLLAELWITPANTFLFQLNTWEAGDVIPIAAKLELSSQQTLAHQDASGNWVLNDPPPNKALELAKCQRYQYTPFNRETFTGYGDISQAGLVVEPNLILFNISTPFLLKTPTLVVPDVSLFKVVVISASGELRHDIVPSAVNIRNYIGGTANIGVWVDESWKLNKGDSGALWVERAAGVVPLLFDANL